MVKADFIQIVGQKMGFSPKESTEIVEQVFDMMKETLERGENIKISGFGNFNVRVKRPRRGRNPETGEEIAISGRMVVTFKPSPVLREALNHGSSSPEVPGPSGGEVE